VTLRQLLTTVNKMLSQYTTNEQDDDTLLKMLSNSPSNRNKRSAIIVRKGEKEILQEFKKKLEKNED